MTATAYDRQLGEALEKIAETNPFFNFDAADRPTQGRQLKTWWGKALADDHIEGHDTSGPILAPDGLSDRRQVLLSALQRGLRGKPGCWSAETAADTEESLSMSLTGYGITLAATISESTSGLAFRAPATATDDEGRDLQWPSSLAYRTTHLDSPAADLLDLLALSAAFAASPFAGHAKTFNRTGRDRLEVLDMEVALDWRELTVDPAEGVRGFLASTSGIGEDEVVDALTDVLRDAVKNGHTVPPAPPLPPLVQAQAGAAVGESAEARAILEGLGIDLSNTKVTAIGPGSGISMGIGVGADGELTVTESVFTAAAPSTEDAVMSEIASRMGIPLETFRDIVEGDD